MIYVTKTFLPKLEDYSKYLKQIWLSSRVTNGGPLVQELENKLKKYLGVKYIFLVSNGTLGLQIAIKALNLSGEIITTPFSYVASTSSIVWEGCKPVFVDIDPKTLCIDADKIEEAITDKTSAILAVHVYGNPCNVNKIEKIVNKYKLKVIYDSAHAFGVSYKEKPILNCGDISVLSFHATKIFHTGEGGAIVTEDDELANNISYMRNFGHNNINIDDFSGLGINAKMSELHAAMGLAILPKVKNLINQRKIIVKEYDRLLDSLGLETPIYNPKSSRNYGYYPIIFPSENKLLNVIKVLNRHDITPRRYFYPALSELPYIKGQSCPIAEDISRRILCLPLYHDLKLKDVRNIAKLIRKEI